MNEKFKNLELKHQQDREQLLSIINEGLIQQKLNENYMQQYYEGLIGNPNLYNQIVDPNNYQKLHLDINPNKVDEELKDNLELEDPEEEDDPNDPEGPKNGWIPKQKKSKFAKEKNKQEDFNEKIGI